MSNNNKSSGANGGMGLLGVLQVVFIVLKLCKVIDWAWGLVFMPLWIDLVLILVAVVIGYIMSRF